MNQRNTKTGTRMPLGRSALAFVVGSALANVGCSASQPVQKSNLTYGNVKANVVKGQTTQAEVLQLLGSPNITTKNRDGNEVWTYSRQSFDAESGSFGGGIILFGGNQAFSSASSATFDLILTFDANDVVQDYSVVQSQF
jgi:outer membrane protein assembly factor BamE (lipoprotein component of BamABCDE complex)